MDRLQPLIFQRSYAMVPHRVHRVPSLYGLDKFAPGTVSAYMQAVLARCGLLFCASGGARFWPTMVGCGIWCFVAVCPLCVWWWCWWFLPYALLVLCWCFVSSGCRGLFLSGGSCQRAPVPVFLLARGSLSSGPVPAPCSRTRSPAPGSRSGLLSYYHNIILKRFFRPLFVHFSTFLGLFENFSEKL